MVLGAEPLLHEDGDEQRGEDKFDALIIDGQQGAGQRSQHCASHPVSLVKQGHQEAILVAAHACGRLVFGHQGVGFIGEGEDQVGLLPSGALVGVHHGNAVKQVAGVDQQSGQGGGEQPRAAGQQADGHILHGARVDKQAHGGGPEHTIAAPVHQNAKAEAQEHIPGEHREGVKKGGSNGRFFHESSSLFREIMLMESIICPWRKNVNRQETTENRA